eukprot:TRINITY_DN40138_c1_g1_i3.p1 TRINITY_DN40138_c1_g1~~TRINITY_DN40138_c1_g1_i3.p1  ORF type:complete len:344 (-),score=51.49 TRINITY_DN40138_c1_g1_i3:222-1118(-)
MPAFMKLNVRTWKNALGKNWEIHVLNHQQKNSKYYFLNYLRRNDLPPAFNSLDLVKKSDCIRLALLHRYGGVWMDASIILIQPIDQWVKYRGSQPENMAGFYMGYYGTKKFNYTDFFENWFIAANKNAPLLQKWYEIFRQYHSKKHRKKYKIQDHDLYKNLDLSNFVRGGNDFRKYLTMHVAFRKAIEDDPESREYFLQNVSLREASNSAYIIPQILDNWNGKYVQEILLGGNYEIEGQDLLTQILKQPLIKFNSKMYSKLKRLNEEKLLNSNTIIGQLYQKLLYENNDKNDHSFGRL